MSTNTMYAGSPVISYVHFFGSAAASCSSFRITSTNCINAANFFRSTHDSYRNSNKFTDMDSPFTSVMSIVAWRHFPITEWNILKSTPPLRIIKFRDCKIFHVCLVLVQCTSLIHQKSNLVLSFLFHTGLIPFPIFIQILGPGFHILLLTVVVILFEYHGRVHVIGVAGVPTIFSQMLIK